MQDAPREINRRPFYGAVSLMGLTGVEGRRTNWSAATTLMEESDATV